MKRTVVLTLIASFVISSLSVARSISVVQADDSKVLQFNTMAGLSRPYTGATNAIRGVPGGGLPWVLDFASGRLSPDGKVDVLVKGLVIDPAEPVGVAGTNPSPVFKVIVSCLSTDSNGAAVTVNVSTQNFPADAQGNAHIQDVISLPDPCFAPILFVTSGGGSWFAVTGN